MGYVLPKPPADDSSEELKRWWREHVDRHRRTTIWEWLFGKKFCDWIRRGS